MKKIAFAICTLAAMFFLFPLGGVWAQSVKIGMIDTQKIMRESKAAKKARDILVKELEAKRAKYKSEEDEARKLEEEIKRDAPGMSPETRKEKAEKLEKEIKELGRLKSDLEEELRKKDADLTQKLLKDIYDIVKDISKKEKYTVILEKRYVVTADDAIDITDKVIQRYDAAK